MNFSPKHTIRIIATGLGLVLGLLAAQANAQEKTETAAAPSTGIAAYETELMRLSEVLGAVHFLRDLCGHEDGALWRERMASLLEAEEATGARKERLTGRFNRGYNTFSLSYRTCTPSASLALDHYVSEGTRLTELLKTRYGS